MFDKLKSLFKSPSLKISETELKGMPQTKLYMLFTQDKWQSLTEESRLAVLQEVENRRARIDGRPSIRVEKGRHKEFEETGYLGYYLHQDRVIRVHFGYLEGKSPEKTGAQALETILHEGRHAFQYYVLDKGVTNDSPIILKEWYTRRILSQNDTVLYSVQPVEEDARRFARREMMKIFDELEPHIGMEQSFVKTLADLYEEEHRFAMSIKKYLTLEQIDQAELAYIKELKKMGKDLNIADLHFFDNARLILQTDINFADPRSIFPLLEKLDRIADEKLAKLDTTTLNHIRAMKRLR